MRPHVRLAIARVPAGRDAHVDQDVLRAPRSREQKPQVIISQSSTSAVS